MNPFSQGGRKLFLSAVFMVLCIALMAASFVLALAGKLTADWVQIVTIGLTASGAVTGAFSATNAYVSGKAIEAGLPAPSPPGSVG